MHPYLQSLIGGFLIGASVFIMARGLGRVTGISGIAATALISPRGSEWRWAFLAGLLVGGLAAAWALNLSTTPIASGWLLPVAGLLVGFGTVLGSGCTSGHGVCGIGRLSIRSIVATCVFMLAGIATVALSRLFL
jgi:uncharacterized protein